MRRFLFGLAISTIALTAPGWASADDQQIAQQIAQQLRVEKDQGNLKGFGIDLQVDQGTVWMKGEVSTEEQKHLALQIARRVAGVKEVVNDLKLRDGVDAGSATEPLGKPEIPSATAPQATSQEKRPEAAAAPKTANLLREKSPSDDELAGAIMSRLRELKESGQLKRFSLEVKPKNGQVWVLGRVADEAQRQLVLETASSTPGVRQVINGLRLEEAAVGNGVAGRTESKTEQPQEVQARQAQAEQPAGSKSEQVVEKRGLLAGLFNRRPTEAQTPRPASRASSSGANSETSSVSSRRQVRPATPSSDADNELPEQSLTSRPAAAPTVPAPAVPAQTVSAQTVPAPTVPAPAVSAQTVPAPAVSAQTVIRKDAAEAPAQPIAVRVQKPAAPATQVRLATSEQTPSADSPESSAVQVASVLQQTSVPAAIADAGMQPLPAAARPQPMASMTPVPFAPSQIGQPTTLVSHQGGSRPGVQAMPIAQTSGYAGAGHAGHGYPGAGPVPMHAAGPAYGASPARYDHPYMPGYAWPSYASYPNYSAVTYPQQYSPAAWPYIGPFYPYPQVPLGWRKVTLEWDDGWWMLDFKSK